MAKRKSIKSSKKATVIANKAIADGVKDQAVLVSALLAEGCSVNMAVRVSTDTLRAAGLLKPVKRESTVQYIKDKIALAEIKDYNALLAAADTIADALDVSPKAALSGLKKAAKEQDVELPPRPRLGAYKRAIVDYFRAHPEDHSLKGLATHITKTVKCPADKGLHTARMQYQFAKEVFQAGLDA